MRSSSAWVRVTPELLPRAPGTGTPGTSRQLQLWRPSCRCHDAVRETGGRSRPWKPKYEHAAGSLSARLTFRRSRGSAMRARPARTLSISVGLVHGHVQGLALSSDPSARQCSCAMLILCRPQAGERTCTAKWLVVLCTYRDLGASPPFLPHCYVYGPGHGSSMELDCARVRDRGETEPGEADIELQGGESGAVAGPPQVARRLRSSRPDAG